MNVEPFGLRVVINFLCGEGPLEGVWFGDDHPTRKGRFWWRKLLRESFEANRDSDSGSQSEDSRSEAEAVGPQSGGAAASPKFPSNPNA